MAYSSHNLSQLAYANGFTLWCYTSKDSAAAIHASGYFNSACDMLRSGDMILVNARDGAVICAVGAATMGAVTVANLTQIGGTNLHQHAAAAE